MKILKRIFELVFIFILPLVFCFCSFKKEIINTYDEDNNLLTTENNFTWDFPFNDFKSNNHYINYLNFNQLMSYSSQYILTRNSSTSPNVSIDNYKFIISGNSSTSRTEPLYLNRNYLNLNNTVGHKFYIKVFVSNNINNITVNFNSPNSNITELITIGNVQYPVVLSYLYFDNLPGTDFTLNLEFNLIDLTLMFGSGYEPSSISDLSNYFDTSIIYDYIQEDEIIYYSENSNISANFQYNYTFWGKLFNDVLIDTLKFNDVFVVRLVSSYIVLVVFMVFAYHLLIWPLDLLFRILFFKERL